MIAVSLKSALKEVTSLSLIHCWKSALDLQVTSLQLKQSVSCGETKALQWATVLQQFEIKKLASFLLSRGLYDFYLKLFDAIF